MKTLTQKQINKIKDSFQKYTLKEIYDLSEYGKKMYFTSTNRPNSYFKLKDGYKPESFFFNRFGEIIHSEFEGFEIYECSWDNWIIITKEFIDLMKETYVNESEINMEKHFKTKRRFERWLKR